MLLLSLLIFSRPIENYGLHLGWAPAELNSAKEQFKSAYLESFDADTFLPVTEQNIEQHFDISSLMRDHHVDKILSIVARGGTNLSASGSREVFNGSRVRLELQFGDSKVFVDKEGGVKCGKLEYCLSPEDLKDLKTELNQRIPWCPLPNVQKS